MSDDIDDAIVSNDENETVNLERTLLPNSYLSKTDNSLILIKLRTFRYHVMPLL